MPKIVNHEERKRKVAEACWRVIQKKGIEQATVREIAKEAKMSVGSMRHYFSSQKDLFIFSMQLVMDHVHERIKKLPLSGPPIKDAMQVLSQVLPIDAERRLEMEVWFLFTSKALNDPDLKKKSDEMDDELYQACRLIIEHLTVAADWKQETERLYALVDGLAVHAIMRPGRLHPDLLLSVLENHLKVIGQNV
ncbi:TetR family transcriptional regulator [Sporolactobacillus sp. THM7-7]|nr:TetR family transcriptional regulator [Sporolactobacillus sp. THM7-7]